MQAFEYKVVPAPAKGTKAKGIKTPEARFAHTIELLMNELAAEGWEYQRAELLPSEERAGLTGSTTNWRNVLVFRRPVAAQAPADATAADATLRAPARTAPEAPAREPRLTATAGDPEAPADATPVPGPGAARMQADDGVEELSPVSGMTAALKRRAEKAAKKDDPKENGES
ncbi:DUF4177 domain-containing protein [Leisingera sp. XS_AS12]|uniref:DUF4177 domain-containing protein n=1 Tax=Leisingera sp. XS_AS12 TaxID=3241294 RepID=UPI0035166285